MKKQKDEFNNASGIVGEKDPFNGINGVVFEDGYLRPDDIEDYSMTTILVIDDSKFNKKGVD